MKRTGKKHRITSKILIFSQIYMTLAVAWQSTNKRYTNEISEFPHRMGVNI